MQTERIATLLASGLPASSVATIVGVSPARIAQMQKEPEFALILQAKQIETKDKDQEELSISAKYLEAEHVLIKQVIEMAPVSDLRDVVGALRVVAERQEKAKSRVNPIVQGSPVFNTLVQLQLPAHAVPRPAIEFTAAKEVIAIEDRNLAPLSSKGVISLFQGMDSVPVLSGGNQHEPQASSSEAEGGSQAPLSQASVTDPITTKHLVNGARRFLDSLTPVSSAAAC